MAEAAFDVVVVGAGLAGLTAANRCAEQGLSVAVLEKGAEERYLCNSRISNGVINCAFESPLDEQSVIRRAIDQLTRGFADPKLADAYAASAAPAFNWWTDQGVKMVRLKRDSTVRFVLAPPTPNRPGLNWQGRGGDEMVKCLADRLQQKGGRLIRGTRARELLMERGRCIGVGAREGGAEAGFRAAAVVLADGGFQANVELLRRYVSRRPERLLQRNAGTGSGDGLTMALAVGADVRGMERFYGHVQSRDAMEKPSLWPYPTADMAAMSGITVDGRGRRFADEGVGGGIPGVYLANEIARLDDPLEALAVIDQAIWDGVCTEPLVPPNPLIADAGGTVLKSDSIEGLARLAGLPPEGLAQTVRRYNEALDAGALAHLDPPRSTSFCAAFPITKPPFHAIPLCAGITYTMGGIAIDDRCRVLRASGEAIEGLYAAGCTTGGHEGGPVAGMTGGLGKVVTFGWIAGNAVSLGLQSR